MKNGTNYAGDVTCLECWDVLKGEKKAQLIDVRNIAEWSYVGMPTLTDIGKEIILVEWQVFPSGAVNEAFTKIVTQELQSRNCDLETPLYLLCRSGVRSQYAAVALTEIGYRAAFNVNGGFEGDPDEEKHRGNSSGWKFDNLPWVQN